MCLLLSGCETDVPDPEGTVLVSVRNASNGDTWVRFDGGSFGIGADDNFDGKFVTIGAMKGIGNTTKIPTSGWADKVAVIPGYGYVGGCYYYSNHPDYSPSAGVIYFRLYVVELKALPAA